MNLFTYQTHIDNGVPFDDCRGYLNSWSEFELLARQAEDEEYKDGQHNVYISRNLLLGYMFLGDNCGVEKLDLDLASYSEVF